MIYIKEYDYRDEDFLNDFMASIAIKEMDKAKKKEEKAMKTIGEYTLNEIKSFCHYANGKDHDTDWCDDCKFNVACAMCPDEWDDENLKGDGRKKLTEEEIRDIERQIKELSRKLEENG